MIKKEKVVIIGGGLAGLTAAIHLSKMGVRSLLIEKNVYPKHKVCGEYISNEVIPYYNWLGIDLSKLNPTSISKLNFSDSNGEMIQCELPLGGFVVSRYALDYFLYKKAIECGVEFFHDTVKNVLFEEDRFEISTLKNNKFSSELVIGAFGKRSILDQKMNRDFIKKKSYWMAVKAHYSGKYPSDLVGLHNFEGGYCGVSKVENEAINICYLVHYESFKRFGNINDFQDQIITKNPFLYSVFQESEMIFENPLTISQISFDKKQTIDNHVLMIGDTAGLIHPLCGNGMAMAIHGAKIVSELIVKYYRNEIDSRANLEKAYQKEWNLNFENRLKMGRFLAKILQKSILFSILMKILTNFPFLMPLIIKRTHGKPLVVSSI
jgi:flavin-dependent dehydrogenase